MKKLLQIFIIMFSLTLYKAQVKENIKIPKNPKVGLSLAGGGAKGFAHVGVLKVIDSLGVKIDYISGTSMGAIVGGLYASGYSAKEIEKIIKETDFYEILANEKDRKETSFFDKNNDKYLLNIPFEKGKFNVLPKAISKGQKNLFLLKDLFNNVSNVTDFSKLNIPFMCVATNLENGKVKIFEKGDLVNSIMASSAYPSLINPVKINDSLYIDGAMTVNFPSKPLKEKGMDIVIGVDLTLPLANKDELNSAIKILDQVIDFTIQNENKTQYKNTDIIIHTNLKGYSSTSYGDKEKILNLGYEEAKKYIDILNKLPKRDSLPKMMSKPVYSNIYKVDSLILVNSKIFNESYVKGKMNLKIPSLQTYAGINQMIDKLYATNNYKLINYDLIQDKGKNILKLELEEDNARFLLKFGLHYDEVFKTGLLINTTIKRFLFQNSILSLDAIVGGNKPRYYFNYFVDNGYFPGFGIYSSGMSLQLNDDNRNEIGKWKWFRNEIYLQSIWKDRYAIGGGMSHDYFESKIGTTRYDNEKNFLNPYVFIKSDTRNDKDFASRGFYLNIEGKLLDIFNKKIEKQIFQTKADIRMNFPISSHVTYRLNLFGGLTFGKDVPYYYHFYPGGIFEQNLGNFVSFQGYQFGNFSADNIIAAGNDFQFRIKKNYFITGHINLINTFDEHKLNHVLKVRDVSGGITAGYKSPFGQIKLNYSRALDKGKGIFSVILGHWF